MTDATHSCGFHCMRPGCIEARAMEWEQQRKRIAELEAENAALKADAERLDWMEQNPRFGVTTDCVYYAVAGASGVRLRDIIDAARRK